MQTRQASETHLDDVVSFAREFSRREHDAMVAMHTERNRDRYEQAMTRLKDLLAPGVEPGFTRPAAPDDRWLQTGREIVESGELRAREVFQIKAYHHPEWDPLYRVYLSDNQCALGKCDAYHTNVFVAELDERLKVVSRYRIDNVPIDSARFQDNGLRWVHLDGAELRTLGELVAARKLAPPVEPNHLREYHAE